MKEKSSSKENKKKINLRKFNFQTKLSTSGIFS